MKFSRNEFTNLIRITWSLFLNRVIQQFCKMYFSKALNVTSSDVQWHIFPFQYQVKAKLASLIPIPIFCTKDNKGKEIGPDNRD